MYSVAPSLFPLKWIARFATLGIILDLCACASFPHWSPAQQDAVETPAPSDRFELPADGSDLIGYVQVTIARHEDTLHDIARRYDLGYEEIVAANPGVDPWLPGEGTRIVLPTQFILPSKIREGLVLNLAAMRLFYFPESEEGAAPTVITHPIGIGREGWQTPMGQSRIIEKLVRPTWTVPASVLKEYAENGEPLAPVVPPGPDNPLGSHAMRLSLPSYLIHGTNKSYGVGMRVSHGCVRLYPEDISKLFPRVPQGTPVRIVDLPYKAGFQDGVWYVEALAVQGQDRVRAVTDVPALLHRGAIQDIGTAALLAGRVVTENRGVPIPVTPRVRAPP